MMAVKDGLLITRGIAEKVQKRAATQVQLFCPRDLVAALINPFGCRIRLSEKSGVRADYMDQQAIFQPVDNCLDTRALRGTLGSVASVLVHRSF